MATSPFSFADKITKVKADLNNGVLWSSSEQDNVAPIRLPAVRVVAEYIDLVRDNSINGVQIVIEGKDAVGNNWAPLGVQFAPFTKAGKIEKRIVVIDPDLFWPDGGVDNVHFINQVTTAQVSNQPGRLTDKWRICLHANNVNDGFTSLKFSIYGERYDHS